jgi:ATP-dependent DNA helicase RecG
MQRVLLLCNGGPQTARKLATELGYNGLTGNLRSALRALRDAGLLAYTRPDKPNSRLQQYVATATGSDLAVQVEV